MSKKHTFHRENCQAIVRKVVINKYGDTYVLAGKHAFEWSVIVDVHNTITKTTYKNREEATKAFNKLIKTF